jgi:ABC-type transport system involved in multi-copper enzyme maturation permease subunit
VMALFMAEVLKLRSTRTALGLFVAALLVALVPAILILILAPPATLEEEGAAGLVLVGVTLVPLLGLVFGILSMTNEYRHGTITYSYLVTPRRWQVIAVKLVVCFLVGVAVLALVGLLLLAVAVAGYRIRGLQIDTGTITLSIENVKAVALILLTAGLMASFGAGLGALFRNQPVTVAGTLIWALGIESTIFGLKPSVGQYLPFTALEQVVGGALTVGPESDIGLTRPEAFFVCLAYIAATSVLAVYTTMRRDVT